MHPLSVFPQLLTFSLVAPLILRFSVGLFILSRGWDRHKKPYKFTSIVYAIAGALLILGLYTQIAAILALIVLKFDFYTDKKTGKVSREKFILQVIVNIIVISLLFTGPGFLAFDLPL